MKTLLFVTAVLIAALGTGAQALNVMVADFEAPTYTAVAPLGGQDGWLGTSGSGTVENWAPNYVLYGSQSAYIAGSGNFAKKPFAGSTIPAFRTAAPCHLSAKWN